MLAGLRRNLAGIIQREGVSLDSLLSRTPRGIDGGRYVASYARVPSVWSTFTDLRTIVVISRDVRCTWCRPDGRKTEGYDAA